MEHDASEIWDVTQAVARDSLDAAGIDGRKLAAIGITNQRKTVFQADMLGVAVVLSEIAETTALGAGYMAGVATGLWSEQDVRAMWREATRYEPTMSQDRRETLLAEWRAALDRARSNERDRSG